MASKQKILEELAFFRDDEELAVAIWGEQDVRSQARKMGVELTDEEVKGVLDSVHRKCDCDLGITWTTLECWIDQVIEDRSGR